MENRLNKTNSSLLSVFMMMTILFQGAYFPLQYLCVFVILCVLLIYSFKKNLIAVINKPVLIMAVGISLLFLISTVFISYDKYSSILETIKIMCFTLSIIVFAQKDSSAVMNGTYYGCIIAAIIGILAYVKILDFDGGVLIDGTSVRLQSVLQYANVAALFFGIGFIISLYCLKVNYNLKIKLKYFLSGFIFLYSMVLTFSRGALLIFLAVLILYLFLLQSFEVFLYCMVIFAGALPAAYMTSLIAKNERYAIYTVAIPIIFIAAYHVLFYFFGKAGKGIKITPSMKKLFYIFLSVFIVVIFISVVYLSSVDKIPKLSIFVSTFMSRLIYIQDSLKAVISNPLLGIGPGSWVFRQFFYQSSQYYVKYIHNGILQIALDSGIISAVLFISILVTFYYHNIKLFLSKKSDFAILSMALVTFIIVHSCMDVDLSYTSVLVILAGVISSSFTLEYSPNGPSRKNRAATKNVTYIIMSLTAVAAIGLFLVMGQVLPLAAENKIQENNVTSAKEIYNRCRYFRPMDGNVYVEIARCIQLGASGESAAKELDNAKMENISESLIQAYNTNQYNPTFVAEIAKIELQRGDYGRAYDFSAKQVKLSPYVFAGYYYALYSLSGMFMENTFTEKEYADLCASLLEKYSKTLKVQNPLSVYLDKEKWIANEKNFHESTLRMIDIFILQMDNDMNDQKIKFIRLMLEKFLV